MNIKTAISMSVNILMVTSFIYMIISTFSWIYVSQDSYDDNATQILNAASSKKVVKDYSAQLMKLASYRRPRMNIYNKYVIQLFDIKECIDSTDDLTVKYALLKNAQEYVFPEDVKFVTKEIMSFQELLSTSLLKKDVALTNFYIQHIYEMYMYYLGNKISMSGCGLCLLEYTIMKTYDPTLDVTHMVMDGNQCATTQHYNDIIVNNKNIQGLDGIFTYELTPTQSGPDSLKVYLFYRLKKHNLIDIQKKTIYYEVGSADSSF